MFTHKYKDIISVENLLLAWEEFRKGKRSREDVQVFELNLMENIISLHENLGTKRYEHSKYQVFKVSDPKPRTIHKAEVGDRLFHHAVHRVLYPYFDRRFIHDSYSCRVGKGAHKALNRFKRFSYKASKNHTRSVWVLKCDIRRFFASIDHKILINILEHSISDSDIRWVLSKIIHSFDLGEGKGIPLGNLTSQLFANVYMDKLDKFVKHTLKEKFYIRYADDFVFLSHDKSSLRDVLPKVRSILRDELHLDLHDRKILIKAVDSGVDFLGWVHFPDHRVLRTATKRRMFRNISQGARSEEAVQSYLGLISHGNTYKLRQKIEDLLV